LWLFLSTYSQYSISTIDYQTPFYTGVGLGNPFGLGIPYYSSAHVGIFAHKRSYTLASSYTIHSPDSVFNGDDFVYEDEYSRGTTFNIIEDEGWSILPQIGLETGLILSAGKRLQFKPKVILNMSYELISGIQNTSGLFTTQEIRKNYALDLQASAGLQVLFLLNKK
jgi:hypothetical protein